MKNVTIVLVAAIFALICAGASAASSTSLATRAKISMQQARKIALKTYPGKIISSELEKEKGGSGLRYSFDIAGKSHPKSVHEVGIDAKTGKVLENSVESDND